MAILKLLVIILQIKMVALHVMATVLLMAIEIMRVVVNITT